MPTRRSSPRASSTPFASCSSSRGPSTRCPCEFPTRAFGWITSERCGTSPTPSPDHGPVSEMPMWPRDEVVRALRARGELWDVAPGVTALRGDAAELLRALERAIAALCGLETADDWRLPPAIDFATLARAEYFASFPHWLTLASHLSDDDESLRRVAEHGDSPAVVHEASAPPQAALNPAVCYHVYAALAGKVIERAKVVTAQAECWRHEGTRHATLERGWAFTMREIVCIGSDDEAHAFLERSTERVTDLARALQLDPTLAVATDPFFAPAAHAKHILQWLKELK